ncbi:MAG TPA: AMP-binding protein [Acidimicrobiales bacterium]|nr:AMP-binding protein [Acidimicrobiales bacterium]
MDPREALSRTDGTPLAGTGVPLGAALRRLAEADPGRPAVTVYGPDGVVESVTRRELEEHTNRLARWFEAAGVGEGDLVTIGLPNSVAFVEAALAAAKLGAVPQPVSHRLPEPERQEIIELADPALVVGGPPPPGGRRHLAEGFVPPADLSGDPLPDRVSPQRLAVTSGGSTGRPKLIMSGRRGELSGADVVLMGTDGTMVVPGPLYHNAPVSNTLDGVCAGNHVVLSPRFDAETTLAAVERFSAHWALLVPTMMLRIWRLPDEVKARYDLSSLSTVWHMGAPCPAWLKEVWLHWLGPEKVWEMYTATEAQAGTAIRGDEWLEHPGSVGRLLFGEMKVVDPETGQDLPAGTVGELYLRPAPGAPPPYAYRGAEAPSLPGGWESLGDMGSFDAEGYLFLADRRADMILVGGANVYPAEVEAAVLAHDGVASCAVIGLPDEDLGSRVHAIVQLAPGAEVDEEELLSFVGDRLVRTKVPRSVEFVDWPVRDDAGKVRRSALRAERSGGAA